MSRGLDESRIKTIYYTSKYRLALNIGCHHLIEDFETHSHDSIEMFIVLSGSALHVTEEKETFIKSGDLFIIKEGSVHGFKNVDNLITYNMRFHPELLLSLGNEIKQMEGFQSLFIIAPSMQPKTNVICHLSFNLTELRVIESMMKKILDEINSRAEGYEILIRARFLEFIIYVLRKHAMSSKNETIGDFKLAKAVSCIEKNFTDSITLHQLAAITGYSVRYFIKIFTKVYGMAPLQYILNLRIQYAAYLLEHGEKSVTEVALESGFNDSSYFARQFRNIVGMTPREYRKHT